VIGFERAKLAPAIAAGCSLVFAALLLAVRPNVVRNWSIYASATAGPRDAYPMFLGPFPTGYSCEVEARIIVRSGGHAFCASHLALEMGTRHQELLLAEFWPSPRWIALCEARLGQRSVREQPRVSSAGLPAFR
jgi:hypothetical protein